MRYFIYGQQDADHATSGKGAFVVGLVLGFTTVAAASDFFKEDPGILVPLSTPFVCIIIYRFRKVKIKMEYVSNPEYLSHESYIEGYVRVAKKKRVFASLKGSFAGIVGGIAAWAIAKPSETEE